MYPVDEHDKVAELTSVPRPSAGAPVPVILGNGEALHVLYVTREEPSSMGSTLEDRALPGFTSESIAVLTFRPCYASMFGPPNDEALQGHPLADRGLKPYAAFEVHGSSWVRQLVRMNSVHPSHKAEHFASHRHYVFVFHDTTFECVADGFQVEMHSGPMSQVLQDLCHGKRHAAL